MKNLDKLLITLIGILVAFGVAINIREQYSIDKTKLPTKLETNSKFRSWLSNLKDKGLDLDADNFNYIEENDIFNTLNLSTESLDNEISRKNYEQNMAALLEFKESAVSPNEREVVNFSETDRLGFFANEVFFYGLREERILKTKIADCKIANCNFHRAAFLDNHVFFVMELSQKSEKGIEPALCTKEEVCEYSFKAHLVDLNNNSRTVYESETIEDTFLNLEKKL